MTVEVTCSVCGKTMEVDEKLKAWADNKGVGLKCAECYKAAAGKSKAATTTSSSGSSKASQTTNLFTPENFKKVFDEFRAVFADELEEVKPYLGGWVSSILINKDERAKRSKK